MPSEYDCFLVVTTSPKCGADTTLLTSQRILSDDAARLYRTTRDFSGAFLSRAELISTFSAKYHLAPRARLSGFRRVTVPDILCCQAMHGTAATDSFWFPANHLGFRLGSCQWCQVPILAEAPRLVRLLFVLTLRSEVCHGSGASLEGKCNGTHPCHGSRFVIVGHVSRLHDKLTGSISELTSLFQDTFQGDCHVRYGR